MKLDLDAELCFRLVMLGVAIWLVASDRGAWAASVAAVFSALVLAGRG